MATHSKIISRLEETPSPHETYRRADQQGALPTLFITPILGRILGFSDYILEKHLARFFALQGIQAVLIHRPFFEYNRAQGLEQIRNYITQSVERNKKVYASVVSRHTETDADQTACLGLSFGSFVNTLWAAEEPRFKACILALGGVNIPEIFMSSQDPLMRAYRNDTLEATQFSKPQLLEHLKKVFAHDPMTAAEKIAPSKTLLFLALFDCVVPYRFGKELIVKLGNPQTIHLPFGHYGAIAAIPFLKWKALQFLRSRFNKG